MDNSLDLRIPRQPLMLCLPDLLRAASRCGSVTLDKLLTLDNDEVLVSFTSDHSRDLDAFKGYLGQQGWLDA